MTSCVFNPHASIQHKNALFYFILSHVADCVVWAEGNSSRRSRLHRSKVKTNYLPAVHTPHYLTLRKEQAPNTTVVHSTFHFSLAGSLWFGLNLFSHQASQPGFWRQPCAWFQACWAHQHCHGYKDIARLRQYIRISKWGWCRLKKQERTYQPHHLFSLSATCCMFFQCPV